MTKADDKKRIQAVCAKVFRSRLMQAGASIVGLGCMSVAAWIYNPELGLVAAGLSLFIIEWRVNE